MDDASTMFVPVMMVGLDLVAHGESALQTAMTMATAVMGFVCAKMDMRDKIADDSLMKQCRISVLNTVRHTVSKRVLSFSRLPLVEMELLELMIATTSARNPAWMSVSREVCSVRLEAALYLVNLMSC